MLPAGRKLRRFRFIVSSRSRSGKRRGDTLPAHCDVGGTLVWQQIVRAVVEEVGRQQRRYDEPLN